MNWHTKAKIGGVRWDGTPSKHVENIQITDLKARSTKTKQEVPCAIESIDEEAGEIWIEHEEEDVEFACTVIADAELGDESSLAPISITIAFPEPEWIQLPLPFYEFEHYYDEDYEGTHFESEDDDDY